MKVFPYTLGFLSITAKEILFGSGCVGVLKKKLLGKAQGNQ